MGDENGRGGICTGCTLEAYTALVHPTVFPLCLWNHHIHAQCHLSGPLLPTRAQVDVSDLTEVLLLTNQLVLKCVGSGFVPRGVWRQHPKGRRLSRCAAGQGFHS